MLIHGEVAVHTNERGKMCVVGKDSELMCMHAWMFLCVRACGALVTVGYVAVDLPSVK